MEVVGTGGSDAADRAAEMLDWRCRMLKYQYIGALHDGAIHYGMLKLAVCCLLAVLLSANLAMTQTDSSKPVRARDLGVPFDGTTGAFNAITDVPGVEVGATTLIRGDGPLKVGEGPVRTGVTAVLPRAASPVANLTMKSLF